MIGQGVSSRSSHSWAAGRTTSSAKPWTQSRMSFWSCVRLSENVVSAPPAVRGELLAIAGQGGAESRRAPLDEAGPAAR